MVLKIHRVLEKIFYFNLSNYKNQNWNKINYLRKNESEDT